MQDSFTLVGTLSILVSGYIVYGGRSFRLLIPRRTGYILYFHIATLGLLLFFVSHILIRYECLQYPATRFLNLSLGNEHAPFLAVFIAFFVVIVSGVLAVGTRQIPGKLGRAMGSWRRRLVLKSLHERRFRYFICEKMMDRKMIMATLESGKVYAGFPVHFPYHDNEDNEWLDFIPLLSGYRNEKFEIAFNINYYKVHSNLFDKLLLQDPAATDEDIHISKMRILIPVERIVTVQPFDPRVFQQFNPKPKSSSSSSSG